MAASVKKIIEKKQKSDRMSIREEGQGREVGNGVRMTSIR